MAANRRVRDLGMELDGENGKRLVLDRRDGTRGSLGEGNKIVRDGFDLVAMTHPNVKAVGDSGQQIAGLNHLAASATEFAGRNIFHFPAQNLAGELHPIADAKDGNAKAEDAGIAFRSAGFINAGRPPAENQTLRRVPADLLDGNVVADDLTIDVIFADAAGDELGVLRAEIEHQDALAGARG